MVTTQNGTWIETKLGEVIDIFDKQRIPLSSRDRAKRQGQYPYYGASGIIDYIDDYIFDGRYLLIAEDGENLNSRKLPIAFFASGRFWVNNHAHIVRAKEGVADDYFIMSWLAANNISGYITGTAQPKLSQANLKQIKLKVPPLETQRQIADILSAYDDLIENNTRRIQILEEMARTIYREWFVHFRYPGHESVPLVDAPVGPVPEGWEVTTVGEVCALTMGQSPKSEFYNETGEGLPFHQGVSDFGHRFPTDRKYCTVENRIAEPGDILFSVRAPVGRINVANKRIVIGRGLSAIHATNGHQSFLFNQLTDRFQEEDMMGGGTIFKAVTKRDMQELPLLVPPDNTIQAFEAVGSQVDCHIANLTTRNHILRTTRDLLLVRLISGTIDISSAHDLEPAVPL